MLALEIWLKEFKVKLADEENEPSVQLEAKEKAVNRLKENLENTEKQADNLHNLLEQGIYDAETFLTRSRLLSDRQAEIIDLLEKTESELQTEKLREESKIEIVPRVEGLLAVYDALETPLQKNQMLKEVLEKVVYTKERGGRWHASPDDFTIVLYPRVRADLDEG